jgi:glycosyltransferase involved in cell wall biosynthesis
MSVVSVIIPTYNRAKSIGRAIDSVCSQTWEDLEIIVVDDGSTDDTGARVCSIADDRIRYMRCRTNLGPAAARNVGLKAARGEYVAFLDSDDQWFSEKVSRQIDVMESLSEDWGVCLTGARIIQNEKRTVVVRPTPALSGNVFRPYVLGKIRFLTPTLMIRRTCIRRAGLFDERLRYGEDGELLLRMLRTHKLAVLPNPLATIHLETTKPVSYYFESSRLIILQTHETAIRSELGWYAARYFRGNNFWLIADAKLRRGDRADGIAYLLRGVASFPFMPWKRYARSCLAAAGLSAFFQTAPCRILAGAGENA